MSYSILFSVCQDRNTASRERKCKNLNVCAVFPQRLQQTIHLNLPSEPKEVMQVLHAPLKLHFFIVPLYF